MWVGTDRNTVNGKYNLGCGQLLWFCSPLLFFFSVTKHSAYASGFMLTLNTANCKQRMENKEHPSLKDI